MSPFVIKDYDRKSTISRIRKALHEHRFVTRQTLFFKAQNNLVAIQIPDHIETLVSIQRIVNHNIIPVEGNTTQYLYSFRPKTVLLWNLLPLQVIMTNLVIVYGSIFLSHDKINLGMVYDSIFLSHDKINLGMVYGSIFLSHDKINLGMVYGSIFLSYDKTNLGMVYGSIFLSHDISISLADQPLRVF